MKQVLAILFLGMVFSGASAQEVYNSSGKANGYKKKEIKGYDPDKLIIGCGANVNYASVAVDDYYTGNFLQLGISPRIGYKLNDFLSAGVGIGYQFYKAPDYVIQATGNVVYQHLNIIYPGVWSKCFVYKPIFISSDFEYDISKLSYYKSDYSTGTLQKGGKASQVVTAACLLVGAGVRQSLGGRTSVVFELMYDVLQADYSPYRQQVVYRAGIYVGL